jgi:hypothetical protein
MVIRDFSPNETELSRWQWSAGQLHSQLRKGAWLPRSFTLSSEDSQLYSAHRQHARSVCPLVVGEYFRTWLMRPVYVATIQNRDDGGARNAD